VNTYTNETQGVIAQARRLGLEAEVYLRASTATTIRVQDGEIDQFSLSDSRGAGIRVIRDGRVGYAYSEDLSAEALERTLEKAASNAALLEAAPERGLAEFPGETPEMPELYRPDLAEVPLPRKIEAAMALERIAKSADPRIKNVTSTGYTDAHGFLRVVSTKGIDRMYRSSSAYVATVPLVTQDGEHKTYYQIKVTRDFDHIDPEAIAKEAVERALEKLGSQEVASGTYPVVFDPETFGDLISVFCGIFSSKTAQEGKSLLRGKVGERVASSVVTLVDDPLHLEGWGARPFDDEGCPSRRVSLIEDGIFKTFLYNAETARKDGVESTGHAARGGYKGILGVAPSNLILVPGEATPAELLSRHERTLYVTHVTGLHAGANAISGDFSLQAEGFLYEHGKRVAPIHNFTVSGNWYRLLESVEAVGSDVEYQSSAVACPSVLVKDLAIAGK
jgi:PmbA protein